VRDAARAEHDDARRSGARELGALKTEEKTAADSGGGTVRPKPTNRDRYRRRPASAPTRCPDAESSLDDHDVEVDSLERR
jgi:hypothetical protein